MGRSGQEESSVKGMFRLKQRRSISGLRNSKCRSPEASNGWAGLGSHRAAGPEHSGRRAPRAGAGGGAGSWPRAPRSHIGESGQRASLIRSDWGSVEGRQSYTPGCGEMRINMALYGRVDDRLQQIAKAPPFTTSFTGACART